MPSLSDKLALVNFATSSDISDTKDFIENLLDVNSNLF